MPSPTLKMLLAAKARSDNKQYKAKHDLLRRLLHTHAQEFSVTGVDDRGIAALTHDITQFKIHMPAKHIPSDLLPVGEPTQKTASESEWLAKEASVVYALRGTLVKNSDGHIVLRVPADIARGYFSASVLAGAEQATDATGAVNRDVVVIAASERSDTDSLITEVGKQFLFAVGDIYRQAQRGEYSVAWGMRIKSPWLEQLRLAYGLSKRPASGFFGLLFARRKKGLMAENRVSK